MLQKAVRPPITFVSTPLFPCSSVTITCNKDGSVTTSTTTDGAYKEYEAALARGEEPSL
jgi:hypothetical protein